MLKTALGTVLDILNSGRMEQPIQVITVKCGNFKHNVVCFKRTKVCFSKRIFFRNRYINYLPATTAVTKWRA